jgi:hypothetical protein
VTFVRINISLWLVLVNAVTIRMKLNKCYCGRNDHDCNNQPGYFDVISLENSSTENVCDQLFRMGLVKSEWDIEPVLVFIGSGKLSQSVPWQLTGYFCFFHRSFFTDIFYKKIEQFPLFRVCQEFRFKLAEDEGRAISGIFLRMMEERNSCYPYKNDLIRNYILEIIHCAMKIQQYTI